MLSILWTLLLALALLSGDGEAQSCKPELRGLVRNLAKHRPAFQSSMFANLDITVATKAVDGNCDGDFAKGQSCSHTEWNWEPWWYVDLGDSYAIATVVVKNRGDCCGHRIQGAQVRVGDNLKDHGKSNPLCGTITETGLGSIIIISCYGLKGRYLSIIIPGRKEYLHVCELKKRSSGCQFAKKGHQHFSFSLRKRGKFSLWDKGGPLCSPRSSTGTLSFCGMSILWTSLLALALLSGDGEAQSCKPEMKGLVRNLAENRPAFQSSFLENMETCFANKAVDGDCNGDWYKSSSCIHTDRDQEPWWYVDLGDHYAIAAVIVKNRGDCCGDRIWGAQIHVGDNLEDHGKSNPLCGSITDTRPGSISTIHCYGFKGRYVSIIIPNRREYLNLCEVEVYGTKIHNVC
ncbi:uncharacterized protein LOC121929725 [Sceloporus undulatus]|uniref:uncharacterized protein LOC121929725 n=1 Tax=Sceloporus undulatus TaxID=8520 RepID=UPI001C4D2F66|nr:uncharacterized protein LOC121929725 [Sceloporus undulatus]